MYNGAIQFQEEIPTKKTGTQDWLSQQQKMVASLAARDVIYDLCLAPP